MTDRSAFSDDEWKAITEAPLRITMAIMAAGPHSPISMVKEAAAGAREMARPSERGPADDLIAEIAKEAAGHEARHDVSAHRGKDLAEISETSVAAVQTAVDALAKLSPDEAAEVRAWFADLAKAVAAASKSVGPDEQAVLDRLTRLLERTTG
jgi:hypothetical protein